MSKPKVLLALATALTLAATSVGVDVADARPRPRVAEELLGPCERAGMIVYPDRQPGRVLKQLPGRHVVPAETCVLHDDAVGAVHPSADGHAKADRRAAPPLRARNPGTRLAAWESTRRGPVLSSCGSRSSAITWPRRSRSASVEYRPVMCSPQATPRLVPISTGTCGRPTALGPAACGDSHSSPASISSADNRVTAAGLSPASRAIVLRATGPWSRTACSTALSFDV